MFKFYIPIVVGQKSQLFRWSVVGVYVILNLLMVRRKCCIATMGLVGTNCVDAIVPSKQELNHSGTTK